MHQVLMKIVPMVVGCLGVVSGRLEGFLKNLGISDEGNGAILIRERTLIL